jgi:long-chain fatty acid transport protein
MMQRLAYLMSPSLIALPEFSSSKLQDAKTAMGTRRRYPRRAVRAVLAMLGLTVLLATFLAVPARAGGLYLNEYSTTSQANAGAGRGAWVPDASATLHNPAAMTQLEDHGLAMGVSAVFGNIRFDPSSSSPSGTGRGGNQFDPAVIPSLSYAHKVSDRVHFGLSTFAEAGAALDPSNSWAGRFEVTDLSLTVFTIAPSVAIRVTDWMSIGGGPVASYATVDWDLRVAPLVPLGPERRAQLKDLDDWQPSGRVGLHIEPTETLAISIVYNSETDFKLRGKTRIPAGLAPSLSTDLPFPQFVEVSAYWQLSERFTLLGTFNWEDWSTADNLQITLGGLTIAASTGFDDTYKVGVGANYLLAEDWLLQTGLMFDTSALENKSRTTALPVDEQIRFAFGFQHDLNDAVTLGASFVYVNLGGGEVRTASVRGDYEDNDLFILGVTLAFKQLPWSGKLSF